MGDNMSTIINATTTNGVVIQPDNSGSLVLQTNNGTTALTIDTSQNTTFAGTVSMGSSFLRNRIINGSFNIAQRGTSFVSGDNDDDTYNLDRWYVLSDGNDAVDITQTTTVPTGAKYSIGLDVETVNKKFGIAQIIENVNCYDAIGGNVTLSFQAKVSATTKLDNVKCAIVAWSGTADTVTSDIISAWGAEGTNPTLIANATYENTPANLNVTTSWATYSVTANVDTASTTNIIVFIWSDVTDTTLGDFLYITNAQLEIGTSATPFERRLYGQELVNCQRYFEILTNGATNGISLLSGTLLAPSSHWSNWIFKQTKRASPTVALATGNSWTAVTPSIFPSTSNVLFSGTNYFYNSGATNTTGLTASVEL
jgi:hypothetical protein